MELILQIFGWALWAITAFFALTFAYGCRTYAKRGIGFQWATAVQTMLFWIAGILFISFSVSKLHLLWVLPLIYIPMVPHLLLMVPATRLVTFMFMRLVLIGIQVPPPKRDDAPGGEGG